MIKKKRPTTFLKLKTKFGKTPISLEVLVSGKIRLYRKRIFDNMRLYSTTNNYGWNKDVYAKSRTNEYYIQSQNDPEPVYVEWNNPLNSNFKRQASEYFDDCPALVAKIQQRVFKRKHLVEVVKFYNSRM